jgi:hypothetical protein
MQVFAVPILLSVTAAVAANLFFPPLIAPKDLFERDENNNNQSTLWVAPAPAPAAVSAASQLHNGGGDDS